MGRVPTQRCETCHRPIDGTFFHYQRFPGCNPDRKPPKLDPPHGGYPTPPGAPEPEDGGSYGMLMANPHLPTEEPGPE